MPNTEEGTRHYSKAVLHGLPACQIGSINRVLLTAARLAGRIPKFCKVTEYIRDELHWLPYLHRITYRISALVRRCIEGLSPPYLRELCCFTAHVQRRCYLCSAAQAELIVPCSRTTTRQHFSVAGPATWNGLPPTLLQIPVDHSTSFPSALKTVMFDRGWAGSASA